MRHITAAVERLESGTKLDDENSPNKPDSIVEGILKQHNDPKLAAVLALDLLLVGVDTVNRKRTANTYRILIAREEMKFSPAIRDRRKKARTGSGLRTIHAFAGLKALFRR